MHDVNNTGSHHNTVSKPCTIYIMYVDMLIERIIFGENDTFKYKFNTR